jgi:hypothetical protein
MSDLNLSSKYNSMIKYCLAALLILLNVSDALAQENLNKLKIQIISQNLTNLHLDEHILSTDFSCSDDISYLCLAEHLYNLIDDEDEKIRYQNIKIALPAIETSNNQTVIQNTLTHLNSINNEIASDRQETLLATQLSLHLALSQIGDALNIYYQEYESPDFIDEKYVTSHFLKELIRLNNLDEAKRVLSRTVNGPFIYYNDLQNKRNVYLQGTSYLAPDTYFYKIFSAFLLQERYQDAENTLTLMQLRLQRIGLEQEYKNNLLIDYALASSVYTSKDLGNPDLENSSACNLLNNALTILKKHRLSDHNSYSALIRSTVLRKCLSLDEIKSIVKNAGLLDKNKQNQMLYWMAFIDELSDINAYIKEYAYDLIRDRVDPYTAFSMLEVIALGYNHGNHKKKYLNTLKNQDDLIPRIRKHQKSSRPEDHYTYYEQKLALERYLKVDRTRGLKALTDNKDQKLAPWVYEHLMDYYSQSHDKKDFETIYPVLNKHSVNEAQLSKMLGILSKHNMYSDVLFMMNGAASKIKDQNEIKKNIMWYSYKTLTSVLQQPRYHKGQIAQDYKKVLLSLYLRSCKEFTNESQKELSCLGSLKNTKNY